jgi:hypothetical protein
MTAVRRVAGQFDVEAAEIVPIRPGRRCSTKLPHYRAWVCDMKVKADPSDVARASPPLWFGHPARALWHLVCGRDGPRLPRADQASCMRERDAPATAGETPALQDSPPSLWGRPKVSTFISHTPVRPAFDGLGGIC